MQQEQCGIRSWCRKLKAPINITLEECVFCRIIDGSEPGSIVYKDEVCTAFMDIQPINPGHMLVIPNKHLAAFDELNEETSSHLFKIVKKLNKSLRDSEIKCEGVDLFLADGEAAGQEVMHTHVHIIPRLKGDGFGFKFGPNYPNRPPREDLEDVVKKIKQKITY